MRYVHSPCSKVASSDWLFRGWLGSRANRSKDAEAPECMLSSTVWASQSVLGGICSPQLEACCDQRLLLSGSVCASCTATAHSVRAVQLLGVHSADFQVSKR